MRKVLLLAAASLSALGAGAASASSSSPPAAESSLPSSAAVIFPKKITAGDTISGSVRAEDTQKYTQIPGLHVKLVPLAKPKEKQAEIPDLHVKLAPGAKPKEEKSEQVPPSAGALLKGYVVEVDGQQQPADKPVTVHVRRDARFLVVSWRSKEHPDIPIQEDAIPIEPRSKTPPSTPVDRDHQPDRPPDETPPGTAPPHSPTCTSPPVTLPGSVDVLHVPSSGDAKDLSVTVDDKPAEIVAANSESVFWDVPFELASGPHLVRFRRASDGTTYELTVYVIGLEMTQDSSTLIRGQSTMMHVTVTGLEKIPASAWEAAPVDEDLVDLATLQEEMKGARIPKRGERGVVFLILRNLDPKVIKMGKKDVIVMELHQEDFAAGSYKYNDVLQSLSRGAYQISGLVMAYLKPASGDPAKKR